MRRVRTLFGATREIQRLNRTLRRVASAAALGRPETAPSPIDANYVRAIIAARQLRQVRFGPEMGDIPWILLLEAFAAHLDGRRVTVTSLGTAEGIARSTAHRWTRCLLDQGLLTAHAAKGDQRVTLVGLSEQTATRIRAYLADARALCASFA